MSDSSKLIDVKRALAEKYERLARTPCSQAKKRHFTHRAVRYRRQVIQLQRSAER
jgi:hypothetical protein